jgi:hypothetical protein
MAFDLFKKKVSPAELETKLTISEKKLLKREESIKERREKARDGAKNALKSGDERSFKLESKKYANVQSQLHTVSSMIEMAGTMRDAIQQQKDLKELVEIGGDLVEAQKLLGFDTEQIEKAVTGIRMAVEKVQTASEMISTQAELLTTSTETTKEQESLRAELMAELEVEGSKEEELAEKIKKAENA